MYDWPFTKKNPLSVADVALGNTTGQFDLGDAPAHLHDPLLLLYQEVNGTIFVVATFCNSRPLSTRD